MRNGSICRHGFCNRPWRTSCARAGWPIAAAALVLGTLIVGCGSDDDGDPQELTITATGPAQLAAPASAEPGLAEITLENTGSEPVTAQLIRVEGERSAAEVLEAFAAGPEGEAVPDWFFAGGGIQPPVEAGDEQTVTQVLVPGTYYAFDTHALFDPDSEPPDPASIPAIAVTGDASDAAVPEADATVSMFEYGFEAEDLSSGPTEILLENSGAQPHHMVAARIADGKTIEDVSEFLETGEGEEPFADEEDFSTAVLEGGESQRLTVDLDPGSYALLCFISDREGGPPHVAQGMVAELDATG